MSLSKKERTFAIWIGIAIGVACSSMLVRYALKQKDLKSAQRPGNYSSGLTAFDRKKFNELPVKAQKEIPNGIIVFHEIQRLISDTEKQMNYWVVETSGKFRSERLFILVEQLQDDESTLAYYRASELYIKLQPHKNRGQLEFFMDQKTQKIIGENRKTGEYIIQIKDIRPISLFETLDTFKKNTQLVSSARVPHWSP